MNENIEVMIKEIAKRIDEDRNNPILYCHQFDKYIEGLLLILAEHIIKEIKEESR